MFILFQLSKGKAHHLHVTSWVKHWVNQKFNNFLYQHVTFFSGKLKEKFYQVDVLSMKKHKSKRAYFFPYILLWIFVQLAQLSKRVFFSVL